MLTKPGAVSGYPLRWLYLALLFGSTLLNYVDRQALSVLKPLLSDEFGLSNGQYSALLTVFMVPYLTMYLLSGPLVDRFGSRRAMSWFVGIWSVATLATGFARSVVQVGVCRFLLGAAEPGNMPAGMRAVATWFAPKERGLAVAIFSAGSAIGSIIAIPLCAFLAARYGWRPVFFILGGAGLTWTVMWLLLYREPPASAALASEGDRWRDLFRNRALLSILFARLLSDPVWYFMLFWLPTFLHDKKGLTLTEVGALGWIPFLAADLGGIAAGHWADRLVKRGNTPVASRVRILLRVAPLGLAASLLALGLDVTPSLIIFSVVGIACMSWFFTTAALIGDLFPPQRVGGALGIVAGAGALGAMGFNAIVGPVVDAVGFTGLFLVVSLLHPLAAWVIAYGVGRGHEVKT